jgi:hypothetical protein
MMKALTLFCKQLMRGMVAIALCAVMMLGAAHPAMAFGSNPSDSSQGLVEMNDLKETSKQAVRKEPRNAQDIQTKAQKGPNSVQGRANLEKMQNSSNSSGTTIKDQAKDLLEDAAPGS